MKQLWENSKDLTKKIDLHNVEHRFGIMFLEEMLKSLKFEFESGNLERDSKSFDILIVTGKGVHSKHGESKNKLEAIKLFNTLEL